VRYASKCISKIIIISSTFGFLEAHLAEYRKAVAERSAAGLVPKPLTTEEVADLVKLLQSPPKGEEATLVDLLANRVPAGVDPAAYVKAAFLTSVAKGEVTSPAVDRKAAVRLLGGMVGGYNVITLIQLLDDKDLAADAAAQLKHTILLFDAFHDVEEKARAGNAHAKDVIRSWAEGEWFTGRPAVPEKVTVTVFKVTGETNTDDLSPAPDAWSRPDIPFHAKAMYKHPREGITNAEQQIADLKKKGHPVALVGDVVGTGSSRKSAANSVLWYIGSPIPGVPNKNLGGVCIGSKVAPIFFNTMEDAGPPLLYTASDVVRLSKGGDTRPCT